MTTDLFVRFPARPLPPGQRVALCVEYDGTGFAGWQAQPHLPHASTVQEALESALAAIAGVHTRVHCAGRTDAGVHARAQWVHFDSAAARSLKAWVLGTNAGLPASVRVVDARSVAGDFHARHSALERHYRYLICNTAVRPALYRDTTAWVREPLDAERMHRAARCLLGEHDFSAFRAAGCQSRSAMRCVTAISVERRGALVSVAISANAFLHHMVRNIVGSLISIGLGDRPEAWLAELLAGRDRTRAAATAPAAGLCLEGVRYPECFGLVEPRRATLWESAGAA